MLQPVVYTSGPNQPPDFPAPPSPLTVVPGHTLTTQLTATDADGDIVEYSLFSEAMLPDGALRGDQLVFFPTPSQVGEYQFEVVATDGAANISQMVTLQVIADPIQTTRVSGTVLDTDQTPLPGIPVSVGDVSATTNGAGEFLLEFTDELPSDTLKVFGNAFVGDDVFPFIAEKLPLMLGRDVIAGVNNVIARPIYLPALDTDNAVTIDPFVDTTVTTTNIPGASLFVAAGTLLDMDGGVPFTGELSITEVPVDFTPAALPDTLFPALVVTIQPGDMVFTQPAPLNLPNEDGWAPGTMMDLWSINPVTGQFDDVGDMVVSADGSVIETISGGVRNSSWHFGAAASAGEGAATGAL